MLYISGGLRFEIQEYINSYLIWIYTKNYVQKMVIPRILKIRNLNTRLLLLYNFVQRGLGFYSIKKKSYKVFDKQVFNYINICMKRICLGLHLGFKKFLIVRGISYQFFVRRQFLLIQVGSTHLLKSKYNSLCYGQINRKKNLLRLRCYDLLSLSKYVSVLRNLQKPDVYQGKGIRYAKEMVRRKAGKKKRS